MTLLKTYAECDVLPKDWWITLHWRKESRLGGKKLVFGLKLPWKARIYTINNDAWQLRHPIFALYLWCRSDPWTHQCTVEELERQNKAHGLS